MQPQQCLIAGKKIGAVPAKDTDKIATSKMLSFQFPLNADEVS
ncbi:hypothetical protein [Calothrix sp. UHCC 0171]|nr:hypothetical protein [Calothrix sp. UHCC 0171]MEA5571969.1 hypothetical protein [Calothrix sp. UHCC 0171]